MRCLTAKGAVHHTALWLQLNRSAYRIPAELEVFRRSDRLAVSASKPSRIRLFYSAISPELANTIASVRVHRETDPGEYIVSDGVTFGDGFVGWTAAPDRYEIRAVAAEL